jgi:hypothetical protein
VRWTTEIACYSQEGKQLIVLAKRQPGKNALAENLGAAAASDCRRSPENSNPAPGLRFQWGASSGRRAAPSVMRDGLGRCANKPVRQSIRRRSALEPRRRWRRRLWNERTGWRWRRRLGAGDADRLSRHYHAQSGQHVAWTQAASANVNQRRRHADRGGRPFTFVARVETTGASEPGT